MNEALLPLFPLQLVLLPGSLLPLHIFEERYKEMIADVSREQSEFGVVQAGEKGIVNTGCTATIEKVLRSLPDGRMDILTVGRRRFEISALNEDKSYLRGVVEFFDDEEFDPAPDELRLRVTECLSELQSLNQQENALGTLVSTPLSFRAGQYVNDLEFRQVLLATRSESQRLKALHDFLPSYIVRQKHIAHVRTVAPRNGHSAHATPLTNE